MTARALGPVGALTLLAAVVGCGDGKPAHASKPQTPDPVPEARPSPDVRPPAEGSPGRGAAAQPNPATPAGAAAPPGNPGPPEAAARVQPKTPETRLSEIQKEIAAKEAELEGLRRRAADVWDEVHLPPGERHVSTEELLADAPDDVTPRDPRDAVRIERLNAWLGKNMPGRVLAVRREMGVRVDRGFRIAGLLRLSTFTVSVYVKPDEATMNAGKCKIEYTNAARPPGDGSWAGWLRFPFVTEASADRLYGLRDTPVELVGRIEWVVFQTDRVSNNRFRIGLSAVMLNGITP